MKMYINASAAISAQKPLSEEGVFKPIQYNSRFLDCIEPDIASYFTPMEARRMSKIIKRSMVTSLDVIRQCNLSVPDAIISATGYGCVGDTEKFFNSPQPTFFINSTHNTISSQIAIRLKCHGFNNTHMHLGVSFESALFESFLMMKNGSINNALVGGYDEMTPQFRTVLGRTGVWRNEDVSNLSLIHNPSKGSISGEGSVSFLLSNKKLKSKDSQILDVAMVYKPKDIKMSILDFLDSNGLSIDDIDVLFTSRNGDLSNDNLFANLNDLCGDKEAFYKCLCGDYLTASAYGLYVADACMRCDVVPKHLTMSGKEIVKPSKVLLLNNWRGKDFSMVLLCGD